MMKHPDNMVDGIHQRLGFWLAVLLGVTASSVTVPSAQETNRTAKAETTTDESASATANLQPDKPRANRLKLLVGDKKVWAELAVTPAQQQRGLMFRTKMPEDEGMLFVYGVPHRASVWMKNTILPLSCAFLDTQGRILEIRDLNSTDERVVMSRAPNVRFMLEVHRGWFADNGIAVGALVRTERGMLAQVFNLK